MNFKLIFSVACILLLASFTINYSSQKKSATYRVAFYNTENFFDTLDDPNIQDEEFLPSAKGQWTSPRYQTKVNHLAKVISTIAPDFIGLAEVENKNVLVDLVRDPQMLPLAYEIVHANSPDPRGIDVAFLFRKDKFTLTAFHTIRVTMDDTAFRTRDILQVEGILSNHDSVCFFVNHWPSRRGGAKQSEMKRMAAAATLRSAVNQYSMQHPKCSVICMGDFNDDPNNKSMQAILKADTIVSNGNRDLFNPMLVLYSRYHIGSLYYKGAQDLFDQIMVSGTLVAANGGKEKLISQTNIYKPDWLFKVNKYNENGPWRTYEGTDYSGGYSDHCAVFVNLKM